jgi:2,4-dienoyl-CoA reductase-like NADH-dependent reductase (Old Yellow Enzyme family)
VRQAGRRPRPAATVQASRFDGAYLVGGGLTQDSAEGMLAEGKAHATVFGSAFLANPDLPERFRLGAPLNAADRKPSSHRRPPRDTSTIRCWPRPKPPDSG